MSNGRLRRYNDIFKWADAFVNSNSKLAGLVEGRSRDICEIGLDRVVPEVVDLFILADEVLDE